MSRTADYQQVTRQMQQELDFLWLRYQHAPAPQKRFLRDLYLSALRRFTNLVNPKDKETR